MRNGLFSLTIFAAFIGGPCQASQTGEPTSIFFREKIRPAPVSAILYPELPEPEDQDLEEDPDSLPPIPFK